MDDNKDNANPVILNASDLPTRHGESLLKKADDPIGIYLGGLLSATQPIDDPFDEALSASESESDRDFDEEIDAQEIYDLIAPISDPEHPLSLGSLAVVNLPDIHISRPSSARSRISTVVIDITPTITHCSLATVIGLGVRVRLEQALPPRFRIDVRIKEGTHSTGDAVTKQLGDKERVAAALENNTLRGVIRRMLSTCE
ncbi:cytoplasmic protein-like protein required for cell viability [Eremomyces bilateralis CBS 781.70]|uniref:Cytoplasmic protein-like protein required for cell viability n=1 Tax=Eremomyces bilateralis CBS 781.70 TaxID=1392243 RepID=A0A6G1FSR0_9PEZI|nr:cytoplasmic protein-like protein required for cell viability [Eremomyces bilateralis CBS 781.70]KAF1808721.1 cytoplasmic protein-like protein required for cell viability [Eremomyces bilateralis CBS 781.70]